MKHVVFKLTCPTKSTATLTEENLWFSACWFNTSLSYIVFKLTYGATDVPRNLIEETYDLMNCTTADLASGAHENKRTSAKHWDIISSHLPKE